MDATILIVEDEQGIADTLIVAFKREGYNTLWSASAGDAKLMLADRKIDLIILDVGLPDISGFDLLKDIRKNSSIPVLFLTARTEEVDRIVGFELGADDYIVKPFSPREVTARIKAVLRRSLKREAPSTLFIDSNKMQITYFGEKLNLSRYEYKILQLFIGRPGWIFSREKIMDLIWEEPEESYDRTVDTHIKTIRAKLKAIKSEIDPIETHRGMGYSLKENL